MSIEVYLAFVAAACVLLIIPGPTITLVATTAMMRGQAAGMAMVSGVVLGDLVAVVLSLLGVGAILSASATLFTVLKWCGAAYLIWLGIGMWRHTGEGPKLGEAPADDHRALSRKAFLVTVLNPKSILFFVAFLPQFVDPAHAAWPQLVLLGGTFVVLGGLNAALYAMLAGRSAAMFTSTARRIVQRVGGSFLIGAGAFAIIEDRVG